MSDGPQVQTPNVAQSALDDPAFQARFVQVINRLAEWDQTLADLHTAVAFGKELIQDRDSMRYLLGTAAEEIPLRLDRDALLACVELLNRLPDLVALLKPVLQFAEFAKSVLEDRDSMQYLLSSAAELAPFTRYIQEGRDMVLEAKRVADQDGSQVTVFSLLRLFKEPMVQKSLRFVKAFVQVAQDRAAFAPQSGT